MGDLANLCVRDLGPADEASALEVLERSVVEVPLYRWLLGDECTAEQARRWSQVLLAVHLHDGARAVFAEEPGRLTPRMCGLVLWSSTDHARGGDAGRLHRLITDMGQADAGFLRRYQEMAAADAAAWTPPASVDVVFAAVAPNMRRTGVLADLVDHVVALADRNGVAVIARASDPALAATYERRWSTTPRAEFVVTDGPRVQILQRDPVRDHDGHRGPAHAEPNRVSARSAGDRSS
ncbi:hypothetical protein QSJ18_14350 [Gordonia sp. ABSL1-1]|uniref:hypothetical protein n=1 Tax=Gordonia sp. ABSL1-1 TaxID=3053923 RepID=UPI00257323FC|nr:hypothetical protein [Gordonia sp. ABSL1-1]MDL9937931.1 hypothetical protein [Gordonia sp. ABSL1-1]